MDSSFLSNLPNSIYERIGIKKNPVEHSRCLSDNSTNEICKRVGNGIWRLPEIHTIWQKITVGKREVIKKMNKGLDDPEDTNSGPTNKTYTDTDLLEQVILLRESIVLIHEQLARIESKIDDEVTKVNARILLK